MYVIAVMNDVKGAFDSVMHGWFTLSNPKYEVTRCCGNETLQLGEELMTQDI